MSTIQTPAQAGIPDPVFRVKHVRTLNDIFDRIHTQRKLAGAQLSMVCEINKLKVYEAHHLSQAMMQFAGLVSIPARRHRRS
jgi:hypothetical protein